MLQGINRQKFEAIRQDTDRMLAASTDGAIFAVALTMLADDEGVEAHGDRSLPARRLPNFGSPRAALLLCSAPCVCPF